MLQLQGYTDLSRIGRGGMAIVYRGYQTSLNRVVAIKFLSAEHLWDKHTRALFDQESLVIAQLNHPNIIHVIDRGFTAGERPYFVMEYVEGQELIDKVEQGKLSVLARILLCMQICSGLAYAHKNGVIHRDIKPSNLLVDTEGHLKILDFGIAWLDSKGRPDGDAIFGTPDYMSPEQFNAPDNVTQVSDIYSLGAVMYRMFVGKKHRDDLQNWEAALDGLPHGLAELIRQCLQTDAAERPASADEIRLRLLRLLKGAHLGESQKKEARSAVGKAIDKFTLLDVLARNRHGSVYLFEDKSRGQLLVIKKRTRSEAGLHEARQLMKIDNPHLVGILGTSKNDNAFIVVMQHMAGGSLRDRLSRAYAGDRFVNTALGICRGMLAAHEKCILHGSLRPSNILFDRKDQPCIGGFGLDDTGNDGQKDNYQPIVRGAATVERDIYSAGAIFHHMVTGESLRFVHRRVQPSDAFNRLDERLQTLLRDMLESDSTEYLDGFDKVIIRLEALRGKLRDPELERLRSKRRRAWGLAAAAVVIAAIGAISVGLYLTNTGLY